jgi:hypothetical protein
VKHTKEGIIFLPFLFDKIFTLSKVRFLMNGRCFFKGVLIFCVSSLSLWGDPGTESEDEEDPNRGRLDSVALLKRATYHCLRLWNETLWHPVELALHMASIENETMDDPEQAPSQINEQCDNFLERFRAIKTAFQESTEEIDALLRLAQVIKNEPQEAINWSQAQASTREAYQALLDITRGLDEQRIERIARLRRERELEAECVLFIPPEDTE